MFSSLSIFLAVFTAFFRFFKLKQVEKHPCFPIYFFSYFFLLFFTGEVFFFLGTLTALRYGTFLTSEEELLDLEILLFSGKSSLILLLLAALFYESILAALLELLKVRTLSKFVWIGVGVLSQQVLPMKLDW